MKVTHVGGVDPGLVHTGAVELTFAPDERVVRVRHEAVVGPDAQAVNDFFSAPELDSRFWTEGPPRIFIEKYQPRSHFSTDAAMAKALIEMKQALPNATVLLNTGVKKVVKKPLMHLLGVWQFSTVTNHQDLRSAARIALLGMLKTEELNRLLSDLVRDHLQGRTWDVELTA